MPENVRGAVSVWYRVGRGTDRKASWVESKLG